MKLSHYVLFELRDWWTWKKKFVDEIIGSYAVLYIFIIRSHTKPNVLFMKKSVLHVDVVDVLIRMAQLRIDQSMTIATVKAKGEGIMRI